MGGSTREALPIQHDRIDKAVRPPAGALFVRNEHKSLRGDNAWITMRRDEVQETPDQRTDDWGCQPCHVSWLTSCIRQCADGHEACNADPEHQFHAPVFFIDCGNRRLCKAAQGMPYTALSYVWGKEHPNDESSDLDYLTTLPDVLPKTIENAITLTKQLDIRYLWVDRYCIAKPEENPLIRHEQLKTMDQIYGQAELTIVSLGGDPQTGLPGVDGTPRSIRRTEVIKGYTFKTTFRDPRQVIMESKWNQRGWTYQEACLSRRKVYFTPEEAVFECNVTFQSEIEDCLLPRGPLSLEDFPLLQNHDPLFTTAAGNLNRLNLLGQISTYCFRKLTYQSDVLNAFRGIISKYERGPFSIQHYWGVPIYERSATEEDETILMVKRNVARGQNESDQIIHGGSMSSKFAASLTWGSSAGSINHSRRSGFPSWSWTGWERTSCDPVYKSVDIGDVSIWIELANQQIRHVDSF
ncbi:hypothetical protein PG995_005795 [Apiospora arundinis]|uniref:Heterokaryon incompatibility protein-domain-containing protein n=1 Tax=Apiospora arundinis TaxID=335852 RepID=A0ABR2IA29_9PEZI